MHFLPYLSVVNLKISRVHYLLMSDMFVYQVWWKCTRYVTRPNVMHTTKDAYINRPTAKLLCTLCSIAMMSKLHIQYMIWITVILVVKDTHVHSSPCCLLLRSKSPLCPWPCHRLPQSPPSDWLSPHLPVPTRQTRTSHLSIYKYW